MSSHEYLNYASYSLMCPKFIDIYNIILARIMATLQVHNHICLYYVVGHGKVHNLVCMHCCNLRDCCNYKLQQSFIHQLLLFCRKWNGEEHSLTTEEVYKPLTSGAGSHGDNSVPVATVQSYH